MSFRRRAPDAEPVNRGPSDSITVGSAATSSPPYRPTGTPRVKQHLKPATCRARLFFHVSHKTDHLSSQFSLRRAAIC